jgi:hypothetical protein
MNLTSGSKSVFIGSITRRIVERCFLSSSVKEFERLLSLKELLDPLR